MFRRRDDNPMIGVQNRPVGRSVSATAMPLEFVFAMTSVPPRPGSSGIAASTADIALRQIADRIPRLRKQGMRISEQDTKRVLVTPAIEALGWDIYDTDEVRNEYRHKSADNPVDYALFLNRSPVLFVEAKPLGQGLDDRKWIVQTINYANAAGVDWCVLTNGVEYRLYKVHAQVEADRKLFAVVSLEDPAEFEGAIRVLALLSRENMRARAIDDLWQAWHVDRQVRDALEFVLQDDSIVTLLRKRVPQIGPSEIRKSLRRANVLISYPNIFFEMETGATISRGQNPVTVLPVQPSAEQSLTDNLPSPSSLSIEAASFSATANVGKSGNETRRFQSTKDLVELGRLRPGDKLTIRGRPNSTAEVIDGALVNFHGEQMSYLSWAKRVTGWKAVQIYTVALTADGRCLDQLRDIPQSRKTSS